MGCNMTEYEFKVTYYSLENDHDAFGKLHIVFDTDDCNIGLSLSAYKRAIDSAFKNAGRMGSHWRVGSIELISIT